MGFHAKRGTFRAKQLNFLYTTLLLRRFNKTARVNKYTLENDYASFESMYDESRTVYSRVLPRSKDLNKRSENDRNSDAATACFSRSRFIPEPHQNLSLLIGYYAQWFSHQFFNTSEIRLDDGTFDYSNITYTNQPVGLNLSELYGSFYHIDPEHQERAIGTVYEVNLRQMKDGLLVKIPLYVRIINFQRLFQVPQNNGI